MRQSRHHGHVAKANDLEPKALRKAGLPLHGGGGRLHLSCWRAAHPLTYNPRTWIAPISDQRLPELRAIKHRCTTANERRITRWEHEHILEAVQRRLDEHPERMRQRRETVEHPTV